MKRGEIWNVDFGDPITLKVPTHAGMQVVPSREQVMERPAIVVSADWFNANGRLVLVAILALDEESSLPR